MFEQAITNYLNEVTQSYTMKKLGRFTVVNIFVIVTKTVQLIIDFDKLSSNYIKRKQIGSIRAKKVQTISLLPTFLGNTLQRSSLPIFCCEHFFSRLVPVLMTQLTHDSPLLQLLVQIQKTSYDPLMIKFLIQGTLRPIRSFEILNYFS